MDEPQGGGNEAPPRASITAAEAIRVLVVKGYAGPEALATALRCAQEDAAADVLDRLVADGLVEMAAGSFRLTRGRQGGRPRADRRGHGALGRGQRPRGAGRIPGRWTTG